MIIKDVEGESLELTSERLSEVTGMEDESYAWFLNLSDLEDGESLIHAPSQCSSRLLNISVETNFKKREIGCRTFSPAVFAKILKAAGVKPARKVRKTNKKAKKAAR